MSACFHIPGVQCDNCRTGLYQQLSSALTYEPPMWTGHSFSEVSQKILVDMGVHIPLDKHGDRTTGLFIGEPFAWEEPWPEPGRRERLRIAMNFYAVGMNAMCVVVLNTREFRELVRLRDKYDLHKWVFTLTRDRNKGDEESRLWFQIDHELDKDRRRSDRDWSVLCHDLVALFSARQRQRGMGGVPPGMRDP